MTATLLPLAHGWGNDAIQEPSSKTYDTARWMWQVPNDATQKPVGAPMPERIYFNAQISEAFASRHVNAYVPFAGQLGLATPTGRMSPPTLLHADALLGYWRDCNNDGYIGNGLTGQKTYVASTSLKPVDTNVCPPGSLYNFGEGLADNEPYKRVGPLIHEFIDIGDNGRYRGQSNLAFWNVDDPNARVWGDLGLPGTPRVEYAHFRDMIAENPPQLLFAKGTFDSWDGLLRQADLLTFGDARETAALFGVDYYGTPLENVPYPLYTVRYQGYSAQRQENGYDGDPMVRVWDCSSGNPTPTLNPGVNPSGSAGDSVNESILGLSVHQDVNNPTNGQRLVGVHQNIGPGCDGPHGTHDEVLSDGLLLPHMEDETISTSRLKNTPDMFFQYRPPLNEPRNELAAWGVVPRADRTTGGTYYAHQIFVSRGFDATKTFYATFYADLGPAGLARAGPSALPGGQANLGTYGFESCTGRPTPNPFGWDCDARNWAEHKHPEWGPNLYQAYDLRDVDCTDFTPVAVAPWDQARNAANDVSRTLLDQPATEDACK